jgi:hypothetical protein
MSLVTGLATRLRAIVRGRTADRELDEEIRFHLEQETEKHLRLGLPPDEARRRALVAFGGVTVTHEEHRDSRAPPRSPSPRSSHSRSASAPTR